ncbi:hypothetical protein BCON_0649g00010 [Botryotinia convoluta]|uniref:Transposase Tc1-like domain-containing protein n=1 Tax=Botryotinia convoluta TaxID=54673 RepID=A0A4Z1H624_9HELO|nr:hypothetical protein BCON_0649g00010 [Botryotinia convoluta]
MSEYSIPTPKSQYHCTCDDRLRILVLYYHAGFTKDEIALQLNLSHSGRRPFLGPIERQQLVEWVCASAKNRRTPWHKITAIFGWDCHIYAIETAFKIEGFACRSALKKPDLTAKHAAIRLIWALEYIHWTAEK